MQHPKKLNIGDMVYHKYYGIGQIEDIDKSFKPFQYLVYYYKENISLHNGNGGSDYHYWWSLDRRSDVCCTAS